MVTVLFSDGKFTIRKKKEAIKDHIARHITN